MDTLKFEHMLQKKGCRLIAGVDEVGVGCIAGDVYAAAVILDFNSKFSYEINDSKKLTPRVRKILCKEIKEKAIAWSVGISTHQEVDEINVQQASKLAMKRAVEGLKITPDYVLVDCHHLDINIEQDGLVKGDMRSISIAAASIIAKETRDQVMINLAKEYPNYGWEDNKGYPTKFHKDAIFTYGITKLHRRSFTCVNQAFHRWGYCKEDGGNGRLPKALMEKIAEEKKIIVGKIDW